MTKEEIKNQVDLLLIKINTTLSQIEANIQELENWLMENPNNLERIFIETDLHKLRKDLKNKKP